MTFLEEKQLQIKDVIEEYLVKIMSVYAQVLNIKEPLLPPQNFAFLLYSQKQAKLTITINFNQTAKNFITSTTNIIFGDAYCQDLENFLNALRYELMLFPLMSLKKLNRFYGIDSYSALAGIVLVRLDNYRVTRLKVQDTGPYNLGMISLPSCMHINSLEINLEVFKANYIAAQQKAEKLKARYVSSREAADILEQMENAVLQQEVTKGDLKACQHMFFHSSQKRVIVNTSEEEALFKKLAVLQLPQLDLRKIERKFTTHMLHNSL